MRITLNLSPATSLRDRYALTWAVPATLIGAIALVLLIRTSFRESRDYWGIQSQLTEVQLRSQELGKQEAAMRRKFEDPSYRELLGQAKFVNTLIDQKKMSLTELSARVAGLLPEDAQLTGLGVTAPKKPGDDYMVRLGINARSEDAVETFINDLEDSPDFKDVSIINQGFQEDSPQGEQVNVMCTARYLPGAEEAYEAANQPPEAAAQKPETGSRAPAAKGGKTGGKAKAPGVASRKPEVGGRTSAAKGAKTSGKAQAPAVGSKSSAK
ncbi:MAG: hypothetical protein ACLQVL_23750 [Terriglobia bacterium]